MSSRFVTAGLIAIFAVASTGCPAKPEESKPRPRRFAGVKKTRVKKAAATFCEATYPAEGPGARGWSPPPERPVPGKAKQAPQAPGKPTWTWVNLWASWCGPCVKEMPLLGQWRDALVGEGIPVRLELWSVDEEESDLVGALDARSYPGQIRWLKSADDLDGLLASLGVESGSAIPIHALVDPAGKLRCVRVGAVGENAYGAVRTFLAGG